MNKRQTGFTLIELMITVAILAIIAAIAYPSYQQYVLETRRAVAQANLLELASFMERYYGENYTYDIETDDLPFTASPKQGTVEYYDITVAESSASAFRLQAKAKGSQTADIASCHELTLNQAGYHQSAENECW